MKKAKQVRADRSGAKTPTAKPAKKKSASAPPKPRARAQSSTSAGRVEVDTALALLRAKATQRDRDNLERFGIVAPKSFGVSMANMKGIAKTCGRDHELAAALWASGWYEARMLATLVDDPAQVTPAQMDRWCRDFDNWAICDTACFALFDRTPHAWKKIEQWRALRPEFEKRAAFALLASVALHDKKCPDEPFLASLPWITSAAPDERNFVKKGVSWALRSVGRRNAKLGVAATSLARELARSDDPAARWIGKDALRDFGKVAARKGN